MFTYLYQFELHLCMDFRLKVKTKKSTLKISHNENFMSIGSCFSENIGNKLTESGFNVLTNPFGVIFNPISISNIMGDALRERKFVEDDFFEFEEKSYSLNHHGSFSNHNREELVSNVNENQSKFSDSLSKCKTVFITFGSAWVYEKSDNGKVVANCHKLPSKLFDKRLLSVGEIVEEYTSLVRMFSEDVNFVFTVSPVRHWKDGSVENTRSKAVLHLAIQELSIQFENVQYFPSYEIVMDELRDYRFFKEDMLHPNQQAVDYVWGKFQEAYCSDETIEISKRVESYRKLSQHIFIGSDLEKQKKHNQKIVNECIALEKLIPNFK